MNLETVKVLWSPSSTQKEEKEEKIVKIARNFYSLENEYEQEEIVNNKEEEEAFQENKEEQVKVTHDVVSIKSSSKLSFTTPLTKQNKEEEVDEESSSPAKPVTDYLFGATPNESPSSIIRLQGLTSWALSGGPPDFRQNVSPTIQQGTTPSCTPQQHSGKKRKLLPGITNNDTKLLTELKKEINDSKEFESKLAKIVADDGKQGDGEERKKRTKVKL